MTPKQVADYLIQNRRACRSRRGQPCPVCGHTDNHCLRLDDDSGALCPKTDGTGGVKKYGEYGWLYLLTPGLASQRFATLPSVKPTKEASDLSSHARWSPLVRRWRRGAGEQVGRLALILGVSSRALAELSVGWDGKAWTFPERNAVGLVLGVNRRFEDGAKRCATGSRRGLTYSLSWTDGAGSVLIVEGGSDVAAGVTMGLAVVGRPSNTGGVPLLRKLLAGCERRVVVVGERDRKEDNRWPGMDGAKRVAQQLSKQLGNRVGARLLPDGAKDLRDWFRATGTDAADVAACLAAGSRLVARM